MIRFDFSNLMQDVVGRNGLSEDDFKTIDTARLIEIIDSRKYPELEFLDLPWADISAIKEVGRYARGFDNFLLLGIGGSALGPRSILEALSPFHNLRRSPKVFIYDNVDPVTLSNILEIVDLKKTVINVITKSGSTTETIGSFMIIWQRLKEQSLKPEDHIIVTTDPEKGNMRKIADDYGLRSLPIPNGIGGRYSVLSPVGLLLGETIGINSNEMLRGASDIHGRCMDPDLWRNPAFLFSSGLYLLQSLRNKNITVMMPYADRFKSFAEWFCQLWAESLGKDEKGFTPYPSVGTTDQHSQLQLWMEGPRDKVVIFLSIENYGKEINIPAVFQDMEGLGYLSGHTLSELTKIEQEASEIALTKNERPNITIEVPTIDEYHLGQLFHFFGIATAVAGFLYGINPFNQPGVEEGKNLTYAMMGKKGFEAKRKEFEQYRQRSGRFELM
ncbi:glucose-6-phosphate isomerase [Thermodesulfovibrionales bacterium]|nr:glucose-6-phosphate isomerase [Thermodesulfovibrionales bacterium]MCL0083456.1 glucose-6-phosphate isomerase [Thermodesulfovibrionales bacterium]